VKFKEPKNTERIYWTKHAKEKMKFYNLSETRLRKILRRPEREEKGVAEKTVAIMQSTKSKKKPTEIWLMYQAASLKVKNQKLKVKNGKQRIKIISAWRYPGRSPVGAPPIPEDVLKILKNEQAIIS
jgi:hypothetical protein